MSGLTPQALLRDLRNLGVAGAALLMVHASMRRVGPVTGGAAAVVDALEAAVGPQGTLVMNLGAADPWDWVNSRPEPERATLLAEAPAFDALSTPADPDVGVLAEVFRRRPGAQVNDHPDGRFAAAGPAATHLLEPTPWNDYYGPGSLLDRFCAAGGQVLRLGADVDTVTVLHLAEYLTPLSAKRRVRRHHVVRGDGRREVRAVECLDDDLGIADWDGPDYFGVILKEYLATGRGRKGRVGNARAEVFDARDIVGFGAAWMARNLH